MEIGVSSGDNFQNIKCVEGIGIDPSFEISRNITENKKVVVLYQTTSDEFFARNRLRFIFTRKIDLAFLDGMHLYEFLLRDFMNVESISGKNSIIAMHDCLPLNTIMASRDASEVTTKSENTRFPHWWTGDVWKIVPILRKYRPDLKIELLNCYPTGLVVVRGLNPRSRVLKSNYDSIIREFDAIANSTETLSEFYRTNIITDAKALLVDFSK
ncbi:class I SAM-dependent methyltransferase [Methylobacterium sp. JK268]